MELEQNRHHLWWTREKYKGSYDRFFRGHSAFIFPMYVEIHSDLHANIEPPIKPSRDLMANTLTLIDGLPDTALNDPTEVISRLADFYIYQDTRETNRIAQNILRQSIYICEGIVL